MRDLSKPLASTYGDPKKKSKKKKNSTYSTSGSMYGDDQKVYSRTSSYKKNRGREYGTLKSEDFYNRSTGATSKDKAGRLGIKKIDYKPNVTGGGFTKTVKKKNRILGTTSVRTRNTVNKKGKTRKGTQRKMNRIRKRAKGE